MCKLVIDNHVISKDIKSILSELKNVCTPGKLKRIQYSNDDVKICCPVHKDGLENKPSCGIFIGDREDMVWGTVHCFACGFKGQLYDFVAEACDKPVSWAKWWLKEHFTEQILDEVNIAIDEPIKLSKKNIIKETIPDDILNSFQSWHPYLEKRKLTREVCNKYEVKYDRKTECVVFPVRDINGKLKFLTRRSVNSKKFIIDKDIEKEVYLLYNSLEERELYVCESQINALTLRSWGYPAVALLGTGTDYQYAQLKKSNALKFNLCLDGDDAGRKGTERFIQHFPNKFITVIKIPEGKDVNDLTKEQFENLKKEEIQ